MPVTVRGTDILFNNGTTQSTAATPYTPAYGAVGSCIIGYSTSTNSLTDYAAGTAVAASTLRTTMPFPISTSTFESFGATINPGLSGTWVTCMRFLGRDGYGSSYSNLWMRIS